MRAITLYRHPECARCARIARLHSFLDWGRRIEHSTGVPPTGPLVLGAIAVTDLRTGQTHLGVDAVRAIARQIPLYLPLLPLLRIPAIARRIDRDARGCADGACDMPAHRVAH